METLMKGSVKFKKKRNSLGKFTEYQPTILIDSGLNCTVVWIHGRQIVPVGFSYL